MRTVAKTRIKEMACTDCGAILQVGSNTRKAPRCIECGVKALEENTTGLQQKSGPAYERWRQGMLRSLDR